MSSVLVLYQTLALNIRLYEKQAQMELTRFLPANEEICVLSVNRTATSEASAPHYTLSSTFTGYIIFIVAIWVLTLVV